MADKPFISIRKSIKWGASPASENTSTLVLTSAGKYFVDVRIYKPLNHSSQLPSPNDQTSKDALGQLEWAFAGTSSHTPADETGRPAHTIWTHWVDSKAPIGTEVKDEGDMYTQANGEVLERGEMRNPASGEVEAYEEVWVDLGIGRVSGEQGEGWRSWVLKTRGNGEEEKRARGMIVRVGEWMQGVLRRGECVSVVRWMWSAEEGWRKVAAIGELDVPSAVRRVVEVSLGDRFVGREGLEWECVESYSWS